MDSSSCAKCHKPFSDESEQRTCDQCGATICADHAVSSPKMFYTDDPSVLPKTAVGANLGQGQMIQRSGCEVCLAPVIATDQRLRAAMDSAEKQHTRSNRWAFISIIIFIAILSGSIFWRDCLYVCAIGLQ